MTSWAKLKNMRNHKTVSLLLRSIVVDSCANESGMDLLSGIQNSNSKIETKSDCNDFSQNNFCFFNAIFGFFGLYYRARAQQAGHPSASFGRAIIKTKKTKNGIEQTKTILWQSVAIWFCYLFIIHCFWFWISDTRSMSIWNLHWNPFK